MLKRNKAKGFTLVELLLVLAIIGIISLIAVPTFLGQKKRAKMIGDAQANVRVIAIALDERRAELGFYGAPDDYEYKTSGEPARPEGGKDILRSFNPKGSSKLNFKITIHAGSLTYDIEVRDPSSSSNEPILTSDQTGEMKRR
jgi:prepilin-type N-terminal cleavage/methylation domain-containing protein